MIVDELLSVPELCFHSILLPLMGERLDPHFPPIFA